MRAARLIFWFVTAAYWVGICVLTHLPPAQIAHVADWLNLHLDDKVEHVLAFATLAGLLGMTLWVTFPHRPALLWGVLVVAMVYGALDEQTQKLVGRTCDLDDWIADTVGAMAGILPVLILQRFVRLPGARREALRQAPEANGIEVADAVLATLAP